jgi:hypothetical protein
MSQGLIMAALAAARIIGMLVMPEFYALVREPVGYRR